MRRRSHEVVTLPNTFMLPMLLTEQATLIAAIIAAFISLITLVLNLSTRYSAEVRKAHRDSLTKDLHALGEALHQTLACSHILLKSRTDESLANWRARASAAKARLKALRVKLRYPLWGLDDSLKTISLLPDWIDHVRLYPEHASEVIKHGTALGDALDSSIRKCYIHGRSPRRCEVRKVNSRRRSLEKAYTMFQERPQREQNEAD